MDPQQWCFVSGKVSALEATLLRGGFFEKLLYLERREDIFSAVRGSSLRDYFYTADDLSDFEDILNRRYLAEVEEIKRFSPSTAVCDFFVLPYEFMNLKNFLKEEIYGLRPTRRFPSTIDDGIWSELWSGDKRRHDLPDVYEEAVAALRAPGESDVGQDPDGPGLVDRVLDGHLMNYLPTLVAGLKSELIREYVRDYRRLKGILMLQRVPTGREAATLWFLKEDELFETVVRGRPRHWRQILLEVVPTEVVEKIVEGHRRDLLSRYEKHTSDYLTKRLEPARYVAFGPEKVFGYLSGLTTELLNLRLLIGGKMNRLNQQSIRNMLRRTYI